MKNHILWIGVFSAFVGIAATAATHYVNIDNPTPTSPYLSWATAATNIQDAVDVAITGDTVLVTNGIYATGGRKWFDSGTNRVTVTNAITLQSVNGPAVTIIQGGGQAGTTNAVRCVLLGANAVLSGFTLSNGRAGTGNYPAGGGVWCGSSSVVSNCILTGNAAQSGGGANRGTLVDCLVSSNSASSSGGGAYDANLINCIVVNNSATRGGGLKGIYGGTTAKNCLIVSNTASASGGAASEGNFVNCTIVGNAAGSSIGAVEGSAGLDNCIVYYNTAPVSPNGVGRFENICLEPPMPGYGSGFTNEPLFVNRAAGDYRLASNSPCINSGRNAYITNINDLDGNPRRVGGTVDIGAYEFQSPVSAVSYFWLQQFEIPIDALSDSGDADNDGANNYAEWFARTVPTNAASVLLMTSVSNGVSGATLKWQNAGGVYYYLQRCTNLADTSTFVTIRSNILGNSFNDTNAVGAGPFFYRVGVQP